MKTVKINNKMVSLEASEGMSLRRKGSNDTNIISKAAVLKDNTDEWEEVSIEELEQAVKEQEQEAKYKERVEALIREKYSQGDEDAIKRKMLASLVDTNTLSEGQIENILAEFKEYNTYAEECKIKAKSELID